MNTSPMFCEKERKVLLGKSQWTKLGGRNRRPALKQVAMMGGHLLRKGVAGLKDLTILYIIQCRQY
jgi:hypothetical protein